MWGTGFGGGGGGGGKEERGGRSVGDGRWVGGGGELAVLMASCQPDGTVSSDKEHADVKQRGLCDPRV